MTKPALISQTNKRGTGHPAESWGGQNTHYSPSTSSTERRGKEDVRNFACFCWMLQTYGGVVAEGEGDYGVAETR